MTREQLADIRKLLTAYHLAQGPMKGASRA
jgi:hypothetical protein